MGLETKIRQAREEHLGYTQRELGEQLGVGATTVSRWERGIVRPRPQYLRELARVIGQPLAWFYSEDDDTASAA